MAQQQIPQRLTDFAVWRNGTQFMGTSDVTLPNLTPMSETFGGAGILGEIDSPAIGQYGSLVVSFTWRALEAAAFDVLAPDTQSLDFRGVIQATDRVSSTQRQVPMRVSIRGTSKGLDLGRMAQNATMDSSNEVEVHYIKVMIDGKTVFELDKINYIFKINGIDYLAQARQMLGF